jgi:2,4-dienoyl-CoA reductase-like NADH-dependent reductase (Old Yellow Enzyme family)
VPALSDPLTVGSLSLRNRLVATAHGTGLVRDGLALPGDGDYWGRLAEGGIAMAIVGGTGVAPESTYRGGNVLEAYREEAIPGLRDRAAGIKAGGAVAVQQLVHLGRETLGAPIWYHPVAPSSVRSPREATRPRPLTLEEVSGVVEGFVRAARNCAEAGFDGVELHAAHGYLLAQFLSPEANRRTDRYGGDREGRVRLVAEIASAIRALGAELAVGIRLSLEPGLDLDELAAIVATLAQAVELDWVNVTVGPRGEYVKDMATERPPLLGRFGPIREVTSLPLIVSQAFRSRDEIETALAEGADLVGTARSLIADPDFARKLVQQRDREIRPCVSCNEDCRLFDPQLLCTVNPDLALAGEKRRRAKPLVLQPGSRRNGGRVAVVGGGPAGLECALTLARAGRKGVVLFEAGADLGGALARAARAPNRRVGWARILDFYRWGLADNGVDVRLGTSPSADELAGNDEIVLATGSEEVLPELPGAERALTSSQLIDAGATRLASAGRVVVVDDGFGWWPCVSAVELAIAAGAGEITVLTPSGVFAAGIPAESRIQLLPRLQGARLRTQSFLAPAAVQADGLAVRHRFAAEPELVPADVVVFVGERRPVRPDARLPELARVQAIGDTVVPRRVAHAIAEGRAAAEAILAG